MFGNVCLFVHVSFKSCLLIWQPPLSIEDSRSNSAKPVKMATFGQLKKNIFEQILQLGYLTIESKSFKFVSVFQDEACVFFRLFYSQFSYGLRCTEETS